jgi:hypothetical protein
MAAGGGGITNMVWSAVRGWAREYRTHGDGDGKVQREAEWREGSERALRAIGL